MKTDLLNQAFYKNIVGLFLVFFGLVSTVVQAQTPYAMSGGNYTEDFANIATTTNWPNAFNGTDSAEWASVAVNATGTLGDGIKTTVSTATFSTGFTGGVQRGTANIQLLSTSTTNSCAIDLLLNFTGKNAGTLTFDAASVANSTGNRNSILKVFYSTDGTTFTALTGTNLPYTASNNVAGSATISVTLPSAFNNSATARLRFYEYSTTGFGSGASATGSQPKISIDNVSVTGLSAGPIISGAATATAFTTTYGTASAAQTFTVTGASLTENLVATAPTGYEVSADGTTYGVTATFTQTGGNASGSLRVRLKYNAPVVGTYNAQTIVLSSGGATSVNITTAASGNTVTPKSLTITGLTADGKEYDGTTYTTLSGTAVLNGVLTEDVANVVLGGSYSADFITPDVGVSIPVTVTGYSITGSAIANYTLVQPAGLTASITIAGLQEQTITFGALANATYGDAAITLGASASSGLTVSYSSSNTAVATVAGNILTIVGVGTTTITASQLGDASYNPATNVANDITVTAKAVTITGIAISNKPFNGSTAATITGTAVLSPSAVLGDDVAIGGTPVANFTTATVGTNKPVTVTGYALTGTKALNYALSQPTGLTAAVTVADQTITFSALSAYYVSDASFTLAATASSTLAVSYSSSNTAVATISGNIVTLLGPGSTIITASQPGNSNYNAALDVTQSLTVLAAPIAAWNFFGQNTIDSLAATSFSSNLVSTAGANAITRGTAAVASAGANSFRTTGFQNNGIATTNSDYFQVTLTAAAGYQASLSEIKANFAGTASFYATPGVSSQFAYSLDGTDFTLIGSPLIGTSLSGTFDLSGVSALQNVVAGTTITLRYYASGQTTTGGWGFTSSAATPTNTNGLNVFGTISALPPVVTTNAASAITATSATLNGIVIANNNSITASFAYGLTSAYGTAATATTPVAGAVTGVASTPTSVSLSGLNPNTQYNFKAIGGSASGANATFYTLANVPGAPTVANATSGSLDVSVASGDGNPAGTTYAIQVLPGGLFVQANGSLGASAVFQTATTWATITVTGLASNTTYTIKIKAINGASVETAFGTGSVLATLVNVTPELQAQVVSAFGSQCIGTTTSAASFALTGSNLTTANVSVGPLSGYTFATTSTGTYSNSLTITPAAGSVSETIFVKFSPILAQSYNGNIAIAGGGATTINVAASGTGINTPSTVTSGVSSSITQTAASVAGSYLAGCSAASAYGIAYSTTSGFSSGTQVASNNAAAGNYTSDLTALIPNTTYYYKAYVVDNSGTVYGAQQSFTTLNLVAPVASAATSTSYNQFTANWNAVSSATGYNLTAYTLGTAENLVGWTFPLSGATLTADIVNANNSGKTISVSNGTITSSSGASGTDFSASTTSWTTANKYWEISVNTTGYKNIKLFSQQIASNTGPRDFKIQYKIGAGGSYADVTGGTVLLANNWTSGVVNNLALPEACDNQALVYVRWIPTSTTSVAGGTTAAGGTSRIDNVYIKGSLRTNLAGYNPLAVNGTSQAVTGLAGSTTYYYEVAATAGAAVSPVSNSIAITTMVPPPTASVLSGTASICAGASTNLSVAITGGTSPFTVVYSDGSSNTTLTNYVSGTAISVSPSSTTTYTLVSVADANTFVGSGNSGSAAVTVNPLVTYYADADGDGYGNAAISLVNCVQPANYVTNSTDCNDANGLVWRSASFYVDADADGYSPSVTPVTLCYGATTPAGYAISTLGLDCDDASAAMHASYPFYADTDGDGFGAGSLVSVCAVNASTPPTGYSLNNTDCAPTDPTKNASYAFYADTDGDGFGAGSLVSVCAVNASTPPTGYSLNNTDCNDSNAAMHTTYPFYADTDGDGFGSGSTIFVCAVNASMPPAGYTLDNTDCAPTNPAMHTTYPFYADTDGDGFGSGSLIAVCAVNASTPPAGYSSNNTDCAPTDATMNASYAFYADTDGDGFGAGSTISVCAVNASTPPAGYTLDNTDCAPTNPAMHASYPFYADADGDGFGAGSLVSVCAVNASTPPAGYSLNNTDCNASNAAMHATYQFYIDADGDGYGFGALVSTCAVNASTAPAGYSTNATDCNDAVAAVNPAHVEVLYNGTDDNCDGQLDEGFQLTSALQTVSCGATVASMGSLIYTNINWSATAYRFKVVNNTTGAVQYVENTHQWFALDWLASYDYSTTYTVSVQLQIAGVWLGYYGTTCTVNSPAVTSSTGSLQLNPSQCGATLPSIGTVIATTPLSGATGYRFRITDVTPGVTGSNLIQVKNRSYHWFTLPMLERYNYGATYMVEVAVKTTGGYTGYGSPCYVYTPAVPMLVNCGAVVPTASTLVYTTSTTSVTQYRFQVTKVSDQSTATFDTNKYWFSFRVNVPGFTASTEYSVRIAVMTAGTWSAFGDACSITSPAAAARGEEVGSSIFEAVAFPNPFISEFKLNVTTSTEGSLELRVYDMLGKLIETRSINTIDYSSEDLGSAYPAGVYNVIVSQGENVKSLRMIKR
jgi:hypothetical protein